MTVLYLNKHNPTQPSHEIVGGRRLKFFYCENGERYSACNTSCAHCYNDKEFENTEYISHMDGVLWCVECLDADSILLEKLGIEFGTPNKKYNPNDRTYTSYDLDNAFYDTNGKFHCEEKQVQRQYIAWSDAAIVKKIRTIPRRHSSWVIKPQQILNIE